MIAIKEDVCPSWQEMMRRRKKRNEESQTYRNGKREWQRAEASRGCSENELSPPGCSLCAQVNWKQGEVASNVFIHHSQCENQVLSAALGSHMVAVGQKSQVRLSKEIKRTVCKVHKNNSLWPTSHKHPPVRGVYMTIF